MAREAKVLDVIEHVYSAALDGERWPLALTALADLVGGVDATLDARGEVYTQPLFFAAGNRLPRLEVENYLNHYARISPRIPYIQTLASGSVCHDYDFISERQIDRNEFYSDFLGPGGLRYVAAGVLINRPGNLSAVAVHRSPSQGQPDASDLSILRRLVPHVTRALDLHFRLEKQDGREKRFQSLIDRLPQAIITLDDRGQVQFANEPAAAVLRKDDGIKLHGRRLHFADATANRQMAAALNDYLKGGADAGISSSGQVVARRPSGRPAFVLALHRLSGIGAVYEDSVTPAIAVFISDPEMSAQPRTSVLAQVFSLTRREADLAVALLQGRTLRDQADARGVKISTERSHLKSLMQKTDTHRQTDLVRLLASFVA